MNIIELLAKKYFYKELFRTILIIVISCVLSLLKINVISLLTANIIKSIQSNNIKNVFTNYKYFIVVSIIFVILYLTYKSIQNRLLIKLRLWIKNELIKNILKNNNENLSNENFTNLNIPIQRISSLLFFLLNNLISTLIPNLSIIFVIFIYFMYNNLKFSLIFLFSNIIIILFTYYTIKYMVVHQLNCEDNLYIVETNITEILNNFDKIIFRGYFKKESDILKKNTDTVLDVHYNYYDKLLNYNIIINIIVFSSIFILIFNLINMYIHKTINITIFIAFFTIILLYRDTILVSIQQIPDYIDFKGRYEYLSKIFKSIKNYEINDIDENTKMDFDIIKIENLSFGYSKYNIINNLNLTIELNNIIGITGISGKGKSTIAKLIIKMYNYEGNIYIDNINIKNIDTNYLRNNIIYVNQNSKLFDKNIHENIFYGCHTKYSIDKYDEIMQFTNIKKIFSNLNFNKKVGFSGENLSGGQRQIINIINGLITPSKIIILDEPTNSLDNELKKDVIEIIKYFKKYKKCIIIISHDKDIYKIFDKSIII
jgi:ABC-type bacteriocin/lantibiotic exporter with double-glycine peptidase domain